MSPLLIPIFALLIPIIVVPASLALKYARYERELEHKERMRALELGRRMPGEEPWVTPGRISLAIGAVVPVGVFFFAWMADQAGGHQDEVWVGVTMVAITSVLCGSMLAAKHFNQQARTNVYANVSSPGKPMMDADAFDVVGARA